MTLRAAIAAALLCLSPAVASGNGRFPRAQEFHQAPGGNADLMVARATFGLVVSVDGGRHWEYWCEDALQYGDGYDPPLVYSADGTLLVALEDGLVTTRNGCTFRRAPDLESLTIKDLAASPDGRVVYAVAVTRSAQPDSRVARSTDNGLTFDFVGDRFAGVTLETVEVAASDPARLYASGTRNADGRPALFRSVDGGARWTETAARFGGATGVYVSGVDGRRAGVLYLRATAASDEMDGGSAEGSGVLFRSDDGGDTLSEVLRTRGPMRGFAISDDGRSVWAGGPDDGVWRSVDGAAPARLSDEPVDCLRWSAGSLWACRAFVPGGPLLLRSDGAAPFVTALAAG
ncbi:MAG: BNR/Asp-box repeat domain protein, partial [Myxococcaceae bacterium]|nr:BNR/Asp-box repeat domain protein [Myxococcaceae bacterium]